MKFKSYPKNKPTRSGNYLVKIEFILGDGFGYHYQVIEWSNKHQAWNASDFVSEDCDPLAHAFDDVVGWCEIIDDGYEE